MAIDVPLRPAQEKILRYQGGRLAVSAVPGSGKTFTLSLLAARLIAEGRVKPRERQDVLVVTYLNASVDNFKSAIRSRLQTMGLPPEGFDVRTMHSLSLEIVKTVLSGDTNSLPLIIDDAQSTYFLNRAIDAWKAEFPDWWNAFLPQDTPQMRSRWRELVEKTARIFVKTAKNQRYRPQDIRARLEQLDEAERADWQFTTLLVGIYERYQEILLRQGALDYDDQIWEAVRHLDTTPGLIDVLRRRWPFILEDEAQDSVPLQEVMLGMLTGPDGNWVRVGDPNQAITSTFTAAHPRFFIDFLRRPDVTQLPLPNSGRSAPIIINTANELVRWVLRRHPQPEVRAHTFREQYIEPTPPGDTQPNPPDSEANIAFKVYGHREREELPDVVRLAHLYMRKYPRRTVAILVPTHHIGHKVAEELDRRKISYDSMIRGGSRARQVAAALHAILALLADPLQRKGIEEVYLALRDLEHPVVMTDGGDDDTKQAERLTIILRSLSNLEQFLYPTSDDALWSTLPRGIATRDDVTVLQRYSQFLRHLFTLRPLPVDDLALALGDELFAFRGDRINETDLAIAYQIAFVLRTWRDTEPEWRLPDLVVQLEDVAAGRRELNVSSGPDAGIEPRPGYITLATQHGAKGLEWDAVFLLGIDKSWIPDSLDDYFLGVDDIVGGDPTAEATAQLTYLMDGTGHAYGQSATEAAHIDVMSERLRLLYVGITRAQRFLYISRSRVVTSYGQERPREPAAAVGALYHFVERYQAQTG